MTKVLIDTSVIIDFLRQKNKKKTLLYQLSKKETKSYISIITHAELYAGKSVWENQRARRELELLFSAMEIIPLTIDISTLAGEIKAKHSFDLIDSIIAATASINELPIATINQKHFRDIKNLKLI